MRTKCDYCGGFVTLSPARFSKARLHFCNISCYHKYRKAHPAEFPVTKVNTNAAQEKIIRFAKIRASLSYDPVD